MAAPWSNDRARSGALVPRASTTVAFAPASGVRCAERPCRPRRAAVNSRRSGRRSACRRIEFQRPAVSSSQSTTAAAAGSSCDAVHRGRPARFQPFSTCCTLAPAWVNNYAIGRLPAAARPRSSAAHRSPAWRFGPRSISARRHRVPLYAASSTRQEVRASSGARPPGQRCSNRSDQATGQQTVHDGQTSRVAHALGTAEHLARRNAGIRLVLHPGPGPAASTRAAAASSPPPRRCTARWPGVGSSRRRHRRQRRPTRTATRDPGHSAGGGPGTCRVRADAGRHSPATGRDRGRHDRTRRPAAAAHHLLMNGVRPLPALANPGTLNAGRRSGSGPGRSSPGKETVERRSAANCTHAIC